MALLSRKKELIEYMNTNHASKLPDIAAFFDVSVMTIRRDLLQLEKQGFCTINRGTVYLNAGTTLELSSSLKNSQMLKEKKRIAKRAVQYITEGTTIFLDMGTTVRELVYEIVPMKNVTVITNSILVINILCNFPHLTCLIAPGTLNHNSMGFFDAATCAYFKEISVDAAFFSTEGADVDAGFTVPDMDDAECKRILVQKAAHITILADSSKIGKKSLVRYSDFDLVDRFITDNKCDASALEKMYKRRAEIIVA